jgi:ADP-ribosylglycohydrolase
MARRSGNDGAGGHGQGWDEPLIDRELERDLLHGHLQAVVQGAAGRAVLLLGESGIGKTALVRHVIAEARARDMRVIAAQCVGRGAEPLLPLKEELAAQLGRSRDQIRKALLRASPRLLDLIPFVGSFLGRFSEQALEGQRLGGGSLRGVYEELSRLLLGMAGKNGLCLIVEDLHAADDDTLFFLHYFLRKIRDHRVLAVLTIQEEQLREVPALADLLAQWTAEGYAVLTVLPLERAHVGEYVHQAGSGGGPVDEAMVDRLFRLTGGNPFFLKETLVLLAGREEDHPAAAPARPQEPQEPDVPPRVEAVLARRLARADRTTRQFIDAAAVTVQTSQDLRPVTFALDAGEVVSVRSLAEACRLRLMAEGPNGEISFVHALMQRAVYGDLGASYRRLLHGRAGQWHESAGDLAAASYHFERAGDTGNMVRSALAAAARAEHMGMYHSALMLYQKVRPYADIRELGPRLGRALLMLGDWRQAQEVIDRLPADDGRVRLLNSELRFVQGDFAGAVREAEEALRSSSADRIDVLIRIADIDLYLGELSRAREHGGQALSEASRSGTVSQRARCTGILGAAAFFGGDVDEGRRRFEEALSLLTSAPDEERDQTIVTTVLGNLGGVAEVLGDWAEAGRYHGEALRLRRETADARGALHSLHALGRVRIAQGDRAGGLALFDEADQLAADLDEPLERAKIAHTRAQLALADGQHEEAGALAAAALAAFERCGTRYDITHALLTVSEAAAAAGHEHEAVQRAACARRLLERQGYGLLRRTNPGTAFPLSERITAALTAYACGDALGLPWEQQTRPATAAQIEALPAREEWPRGATSDDTALTMLVADYLADHGDDAGALTLLAQIAEQAPQIRGMGPSTGRAVERFRSAGELPHDGGATNGAVMRALPIGWATPLDAGERRRRLAIELSRATHPSAEAQCAACVAAACASWAIEGASPRLVAEVAVSEAAEAALACGAEPGLEQILAAVAAGTWPAPEDGVPLEPYQTVAAVLSCLLQAASLRDALVMAVRLGGDTDTVAALTGGLAGARHTPDQVTAALPWSAAVRLPPATALTGIGERLARLRTSTREPPHA